MNILITGCFGFIGSNLTIRLLNAGYKILGFDNLSNSSIDAPSRIKKWTGENWNNLTFYKCDITDIETMGSILTNHKVDYIIHLAAMGSVTRSFIEPSNYVRNNIEGTSNIFLLANTFKVKKVVFASSSSVYGDIDPEKPRVEHLTGKQLNPYAFTKKANEDFARMWSKATGLNYIGLRFFNVYGPGQREDSEYSAVIPRFINEEIITINGDGNTVRDFTYVDDVCDAICASLITSHNNEIYNVGTGKKISILNLAKLIDSDKKIEHKKERKGEIKISVADTTKSMIGLSFVAKTDLKTGIEKTKQYFLLRNKADND